MRTASFVMFETSIESIYVPLENNAVSKVGSLPGIIVSAFAPCVMSSEF